VVRPSRIWAPNLHRRRSPPHCILYRNEPTDYCQQLSACDGSACFLLIDKLSAKSFLLME
jgi:hypothetical protein